MNPGNTFVNLFDDIQKTKRINQIKFEQNFMQISWE